MDDSEDLKKIDEIIKKHKTEAQEYNELEYAEFIDYTDNNEADDSFEIEDYEIPDFSKSDILKFHTYNSDQFFNAEEKRVIESCTDPDLRQLLLLNRNKSIQLMQLHKKIKDILTECHQNICVKEEIISAARNSKRVCNRIWRLGIPYFKTKDDFPCPRNEDLVRKHNNGELLYYDMSPSNKWLEKDTNRLLKGVAFHYKIFEERELEQSIKQLEKEVSENPDAENEELIQELKNDLEDTRNSETDLYPPLGCDKDLDWNRISRSFLGERHSAQECKVFWNTYLHPEINKVAWTPEEDKKLKQLALQYNFQNWDLIASKLGNKRTGFVACVHYFCKIDPPRLGRFTPAEDKLLCDMVEHYRQGEYIPWTKLVHHFKDRTRGQLFYRYKYFLSCRSGKVKGKFSEAEDILIMVLVDRFGKKFTKCGEYFPNRSVVQIKARYTSNLKGAIKKGSFAIEEDREILKYVEEKGTSTWEPLVKRLSRCGGQIRQRYRTLTAFMKAHPGADLKHAPRRRFSGLAFETEYDFLRCMANKFKDCDKIPTLQDIEKLLLTNPKPKPSPLEPLQQNRKRRSEDSELTVRRTENPAQYTRKTRKKERETASSLPLPEDQSDIDDEFAEIDLSVDSLLIDFFSSSIKLHMEQKVNKQDIKKAAATVSSVLSTFKAELHIPKDFKTDSRLDAIDAGILTILTQDRPVDANDEYVISRDNLQVDRLIPPNLNTVVGMRSLLIKNQVYKSKNAKRVYIFDNFKTDFKEKQVRWCINNHLSNQPQDTQDLLLLERTLFFRRFLSLFKFAAIMTLQQPSELLESTFRSWKTEFTKSVRTYGKRSRPALTQGNNSEFETVFIKQQPEEWEEESHLPTEQKRVAADVSNNEVCPVARPTAAAASDPLPKLSMVEQLKRRINETIDELNSSPPPKKHYKDFSKEQTLARYKKPPQVPAPKIAGASVVDVASNEKKNKPVLQSSKDKEPPIKSESLQDIDLDNSGAYSSFNLGKGELILEDDSPGDDVHESNSISQDLLDLSLLDEALKKERNLVEESFEF